MSDIRLFKTAGGRVTELESKAVAIERSLQSLIEKHSEAFLAVRFLESEYATGKKHAGRIDTLGIDENHCPVIIEYKRSTNQNVVNQGLFYLDWLLDHKAEFQLLVMNRLGKEAADKIDWSSTRLLCIAGDFTRYDEHAVIQINRNIELIRYRRYGDELLLLELVNAVTADAPATDLPTDTVYKTVSESLESASTELSDVYYALKETLLAFGDDVQMKTLKFYYAFKRIKNFACVELRKQKGEVLIYVKVDPDSIDLVDGFTRDVRKIGHFGTGDLEITVKTLEDIEKARPFLERSYEAN